MVKTLSASSRFCEFKRLAVCHKISANWQKFAVIGGVSHDFLPIGRKVMKLYSHPQKIVSSDYFIAILQKKIVDQIAINYRFLSKSRAIAIKRTINRPENSDKIVDFAVDLMTWVSICLLPKTTMLVTVSQ